jgi:hypothetical protein
LNAKQRKTELGTVTSALTFPSAVGVPPEVWAPDTSRSYEIASSFAKNSQPLGLQSGSCQSRTIALCYRVLQMDADSLKRRYKNTLPASGYEWISNRESIKDEVASLDMPLVHGLGRPAEAPCFTGMYACCISTVAIR